jgi:hypothetical protein
MRPMLKNTSVDPVAELTKLMRRFAHLGTLLETAADAADLRLLVEEMRHTKRAIDALLGRKPLGD